MNILREKDFSLPSEVKIGCHVYAIKSIDPELANALKVAGRCMPDCGVIELAADLNRGQALEVLLHEILHAIFHVFVIEDEDKGERTVSILGTALAWVFQDNPEFIKLYLPLLACPPVSPTPSLQ